MTKRQRSLSDGLATAPTRGDSHQPAPVVEVSRPGPGDAAPGRREITGTYRDFVKRDTKIWPDQDTELKALEAAIRDDLRARGIKPARRITINTLVRVALDNFLADAANVRGASEAELLANLRRPGNH